MTKPQDGNWIFSAAVAIFTLLAGLSSTIYAQQTSTTPQADPLYKNASLPIQDRVNDLLSRMTLEEKVFQMASGWDMQLHVIDPTGTYTDESARYAIRMEWGEEIKFTPRQSAILRNAAQRYQLEKTRLGIPILFQSEALHGFMEYGSTSFPQAIGLASTWNPALVKRIFTAIGDEAGSRAAGQVFSPVLDLARDPRWGRTEETFGEDPLLVTRMGIAAIEGLQGDAYMIDRHHVMATMKHFAVHGQPEGGTNTAPGNISERIIRETFFIPFKAAVQEARVGSVMASYNEIDGIPSHINPWLLNKVLRQEWGFDGSVVSDGGGLQMLVDTHHVAYNYADAARKALAAGVEFDTSDGSVYRTLVDQVKQGIVPVGEVDRAVAHILTVKFRLGLFDQPYVDPDYAEKVNNSPEHKQLALEAARQVMVLLKNEKNLLPLDLNKLKTIAVIGPNAADVHLGGYSRDPGFGISILDGIRQHVGNKANVLYAQGCKITDAPEGYRGWWANDVHLIDPKTQQASILQAVEIAKKSDVAILVVGGNESTTREASAEVHLGDRDSLDLLGAQNDLVKAVVETGKPVVVILINGRPLSINYITEKVPAILEGWYLGEEGGPAAAEVLFGDTNPGGKLPITFPRSVGDLPDYYYRKPSANRTYAFSTREPLFPFGFGLSYTTFKFSNLRVEPKQILAHGTATVSVDVTNTGAREGDEVAQLYLREEVTPVTQPVMLLKGFERISLKPGETRTVAWKVTPEMLAILDTDMQWRVVPGTFDVMVGPSSVQTSMVKLDVADVYGNLDKPLPPLPPAGSESGVVSNFDDVKPTANFGSWMAMGDAQLGGGKSTAKMDVIEPGADGSNGALQITGEVIAGPQFAWAGLLFSPGSAPMESANLSQKKSISFLAKGDSKTYKLILLTSARSGQNGQMPAMTSFTAGPEWKQYDFPLSTFETDGSDVIGVGFIRAQETGKFQFEIDQVAFK
jgi:beta-glucosidase